jgi:hypothetical protein
MSPAPPRVVPPAARSTRLGIVTLLLLSLPFWLLGVWLLDGRARITLDCPPTQACTLTRGGWLTREVAVRFGPGDVQALRVERLRSSRGSARLAYRPVLELARGRFPLTYRWSDSPEGSEAVVARVEAWRAAPQQGLVLVHDERRGAALSGGVFVAFGTGLLGAALWVAARARRAQTAHTPPGLHSR